MMMMAFLFGKSNTMIASHSSYENVIVVIVLRSLPCLRRGYVQVVTKYTTFF